MIHCFEGCDKPVIAGYSAQVNDSQRRFQFVCEDHEKRFFPWDGWIKLTDEELLVYEVMTS